MVKVPSGKLSVTFQNNLVTAMEQTEGNLQKDARIKIVTAPLALRTFLDAQSSSDYGGMFAMSVVSLLPLFLVFLFGQRWLLRGIATTGIK